MAVDLAGQRFGRLTAVRPTEKRSGNSVVWECRCDCGNAVLVSQNDLRSGCTQSCGCLRKEWLADVLRVDLTGQRFGRLVAVRPTEERKYKSVVWECRCDCGNAAFVPARELRNGNIKSCGCLYNETAGTSFELVGQTSVSLIRSKKLRINNTTGCTGVCFHRGKYTATIGFQKKSYYLGIYAKIEDAVKVRKKAEALLHDETVDYYNRWRTRADADPEWAKENPIKISVAEDAAHDFKVSFDPVL